MNFKRMILAYFVGFISAWAAGFIIGFYNFGESLEDSLLSPILPGAVSMLVLSYFHKKELKKKQAPGDTPPGQLHIF